MIYLVAAYISALVILGGFLALSLRSLRELLKKGPPKSL
jgi:hypothetical protein